MVRTAAFVFIAAGSIAAPAQEPVDTAGELSGLDMAAELSSLVSASRVNALNWLRAGGDPDTVIDDDGNTVMHYAAANPYPDILQEAVRRGGHCNRKNSYGATPLHFAASKGGEYLEAAAQAVRILARCEAAPDVRRTCAGSGQVEEQCRADPNAQDRRGGTPLHTLYEGLESTRGLAGRGEANAAVQQALLEVGADPNVRNYAGDTPLMLAIRYKGVMFTKPGHVLQLLKHDADPDIQNNRDDTPLIETASLTANAISADDDPVQVIVALLRHGADPDLRAGIATGNSDTPLIRAARHENDSVYEIEALLAGGADPCLRDRGGRLAYDHAAEGSAGQQALYDAGGYPDPDTGLCVRDLISSEGTTETDQHTTELQTERARQARQEQAEREQQAPTAPAQELAGEMVSIPGGTFRMGDLSGESYGSQIPVRSVTVPAFKLGKYEVTFAQWDACVANGGCNGYSPLDGVPRYDEEGRPAGVVSFGRGNRPVVNVSWDDVQSFIDWLNEKTGGNYRLPTEAEWEYAVRAGSTTEYSWGDDIGNNRANCNNVYCRDSWDYTAPVGSFPANAWGLHDMHGNIWEWVQDCWNDSYAGAPKDGSAWMSGDCGQRVVRGGSWGSLARYLRSASRHRYGRSYRSIHIGFRLAQDE